VIRLYYQEETCEEIGAALQMPAATVRRHLLRGRRKLLVYLVERQSELFGGAEGIDAVWQCVRPTNLRCPCAKKHSG
jgi:hypothetical protein